MRVRWLAVPLLALACRPAEPPGTLVYASGADLQSINPLRTTHPLAKQVQRFALFMTLVRYDSTLTHRPYLAASWSWSPDRRSLALRLRDDVRWHDGRPTSAADVAFTLDAARDPSGGYPRSAELACLRRVSVEGPLTLRLDYCSPQAGLADVLADLAILPEHLLADGDAGSFEAHPTGNGPYRFVEHLPNRRWVFEANPGFPAALGGPPRIPRLVVAVVDEATTKLAGLVAGELDVAGIAPLHASLVRRVRGCRVVDYPLLFTYGLVWNTARAPFDDARLRRALTMAIDRRQILDAYVYGFGEPADGPVPPAHPRAAAVRPVPFDRQGAMRLLDSLGWRTAERGVRERSGRRLAFSIATVGSADNVLEQLIQADLAAVGVEVRIRQLELGSFLALAEGAGRDYDALVTGIGGDLDLGYLGGLFDSRRRSGALQYAQYSNPEVDRALDAGDLVAVQRIVAREVPITFLYHARGVQGVRDRLAGLHLDLRGELASLPGWRLEEGSAGDP